MSRDAKALLKQVLDLAAEHIDPARVAEAKRRQGDTFAWREGDYLPLFFRGDLAVLKALPDFDWAEQFDDPAASLYMQLKEKPLTWGASGCDWVPTVRADTGVINGPTVLGAAWDVPAHTKPVVSGRVSREDLDAFEVPDDISHLGVIPRMIEHTQHHLAALAEAGLDDRIGVRHCDIQGPFDIAAQARGHDNIFLDMYTDVEFFHGLMEKSLVIFIKLARLSKQLVGDPLDSGYANEFWMAAGSVRLCDDSGILVSAEMYAELLAPYVQRALEPFGGGWIHYCGGVSDGNRPEGLHLHEVYCSIARMRGLQFTTAADLQAEVSRLIDKKVNYLGGLPRGDGEPLEDYFRRALRPCIDGRRGMLLGAVLREGETAAALDTWHRVQDEMFG